MPSVEKKDNGNLKAKLDLRRHFLRKYHADGDIRVFDCCQGSGVIWKQLREEFDVKSYWGVDMKPKGGRLKIDSQRILCHPGMRENVIDIDTYGSPWKHWAALLPTLNRDVTVFLTIGQWQMGTCSQIPKGIGLDGLHIPPGILSRLHGFATSYLLTMGCGFSTILKEAVEAVSVGTARYIGVRLEMKRPAVASTTAGQQSTPERKVSNASGSYHERDSVETRSANARRGGRAGGGRGSA